MSDYLYGEPGFRVGYDLAPPIWRRRFGAADLAPDYLAPGLFGAAPHLRLFGAAPNLRLFGAVPELRLFGAVHK